MKGKNEEKKDKKKKKNKKKQEKNMKKRKRKKNGDQEKIILYIHLYALETIRLKFQSVNGEGRKIRYEIFLSKGIIPFFGVPRTRGQNVSLPSLSPSPLPLPFAQVHLSNFHRICVQPPVPPLPLYYPTPPTLHCPPPLADLHRTMNSTTVKKKVYKQHIT